MITGFDYIVLTNRLPEIVEQSFFQRIEEMWPSAVIKTYKRTANNIEIFISKDLDMVKFQDDNGYVLNENDEGSFMFYARHFSEFHCDARVMSIISPAELTNVEPYITSLFFTDLWEYTLVLPASIDECKFAKKMHEFLMDSIAPSTATK